MFARRAKTERGENPVTQAGAHRVSTETFLDAGSVLAGELRFTENVRLEGRVEGQIWAGNTVVVGESAEIDATIEADTLEIYGTVIGDIRVFRQTTLHKTARVEGEIQTAGIVVEEGARFKGCILIGPGDESMSPTTAPSESPCIESSTESQAYAQTD